MTRPNPLEAFRAAGRVCVLDGGLATTLEAAGHSLDDALWSARLLLDDPAAIRAAHRSFLEAGADCLATATYQASLPGFRARGLDDARSEEVLREAVTLALGVRDQFWAESGSGTGRARPMVAASVGPYGAYLADGSEYAGSYGATADALLAFHARRWHVLAESGADLLACETLPDVTECAVLLKVLRETPEVWAWFSFSCRDARHLHDGTPIATVAAMCDRTPGVAGVGINCTAPALITPLIREVQAATTLPVLVYPNSGEVYEPAGRSWRPGAGFDWDAGISEWRDLGVTAIGGCCRVGPDRIAAIRTAVE